MPNQDIRFLTKKEKSKRYFQLLEKEEKPKFEALNLQPNPDRAKFGNVVEGESFCIGEIKVKSFNLREWEMYYGNLCQATKYDGWVFCHPRYQNKIAVLRSGYTKATFKKLFTAFSYRTFIDPIKPLVKDYCFGYNRKINPSKVEKVWKMKDILEQNITDGVENISPLCLHFQKSPKEMKEMLGKSLWKSLCKNSKSRNRKIVQCLPPTKGFQFQRDLDNLRYLQSVPSTLLHPNIVFFPVITWWWPQNKEKHPMKYILKKWHKDDEVKKQVDFFNDMLRFRRQVLNIRGYESDEGEKELHSLSLRRVKELHDEYQQELVLRESRRESAMLVDYPVFTEGGRNVLYELKGKDGWKATLLTKGCDIIAEGIAMKHCVGGYARSVEDGKHLVYSITRDGQRVSTLAYRTGNRGTQFYQHYKACNKPVDEDGAEKLEEKITEWYKEMEK